MQGSQTETQQQESVPSFTIPGVNYVIDRLLGLPSTGDQAINTFTTCGIDVIVASTHCEYPLATCVAILLQLAYSPESTKVLGERGELTMSIELDEGTMETAFTLLPESTPETNFQFVIHGLIAYVTLPSFHGWRYSDTKEHWLRDNLVADIQRHMAIYKSCQYSI